VEPVGGGGVGVVLARVLRAGARSAARGRARADVDSAVRDGRGVGAHVGRDVLGGVPRRARVPRVAGGARFVPVGDQVAGTDVARGAGSGDRVAGGRGVERGAARDGAGVDGGGGRGARGGRRGAGEVGGWGDGGHG